MLIVTIAALVMAAGLGWFAYRLLQEEQRRSDARVALLTAALDTHSAPRPDVADGMGLQARRRAIAGPDIVAIDGDGEAMRGFASEGRVVASTPIAADASEDLLRAAPGRDVPAAEDTHGAAPVRETGLFAAVPESRPADARGLLAVAGVVVIGLLAAGYAWLGGSHTGTAQQLEARSVAPMDAGAVVPLELLSLRHDQRGGAIVVEGLVRNPVSGRQRPGVHASVVLLDEAGGVLGSARAPLQAPRLGPGDEARFTVRLTPTAGVRRYRVTFRTPGGDLVAHADRRN